VQRLAEARECEFNLAEKSWHDSCARGIHSTVSLVGSTSDFKTREFAGIMTGSPDGTKSSQWLSVAILPWRCVVFARTKTEGASRMRVFVFGGKS